MIVSVETSEVAMLNEVVVAPAGIVTIGGVCAATLFDHTATFAPPAGAGPLSVIVPVATTPEDTGDDGNAKVWTDELPVNGLCAIKASEEPLLSFATRLDESESNAIVAPLGLTAESGELDTSLPAAPLLARLTTAVWPATVSRSRVCRNPTKETNLPSALIDG